VDAFGLVHSSSFADNEEKTAARRKSIEFIRTNGSLAFLKTSTPGLFSDSWKLTNPEAVEMLIDKGRSFLPEALVQYYELMIARPDRLAILEKTAKPVLFIIGQYDNAIPFTASMQQCHVPAKSHIHILRHSGHMGMWEEPQNTNAALAGFLGQFPALA
jgi:pimeloyl-ACP methyl ester carboxylesterase